MFIPTPDASAYPVAIKEDMTGQVQSLFPFILIYIIMQCYQYKQFFTPSRFSYIHLYLELYHCPMLLEAHAVHALQSLLKPLKLLQPLINSTL